MIKPLLDAPNEMRAASMVEEVTDEHWTAGRKSIKPIKLEKLSEKKFEGGRLSFVSKFLVIFFMINNI
jgi:hypothetical protein